MLRCFKCDGKLKIPVVAYRTYSTEFVIFEYNFDAFSWDRLFSSKLCILNLYGITHQVLDVQDSLQELLDLKYSGYLIVDVFSP